MPFAIIADEMLGAIHSYQTQLKLTNFIYNERDRVQIV